MPERFEALLYVSLGLVLCVFLFFLSLLGPFGWLLAAFLLASTYLLLAWSGYLGGQGGDAPRKTNCRACGARNAIDRDDCSYCGEPLAPASGR